MFIDNIKMSQKAKDQLTTLKRRTGIPNWNILCRWALCRSLAEPTPPARSKIPMDSNVEMSWTVFGGEYESMYAALVKQRCSNDGLELTDAVLSEQFKLHLHRGISYLAGDKNTKTIDGFLGRV
jgi:DNA sulfur modification protein DndE